MQLCEFIDASRRIQEDFYPGDISLRGRLIQGILRNIGDIAPPIWAIDLFSERSTETRADLMAMIDVFIYAASLISTVDMSVDELSGAISSRQAMVSMMHQSLTGLQELRRSGLPICVFDVDGVLFPYPTLFDDFLASKMLETPSITRDDAKDLYRRSGIKAEALPVPGAKELFDCAVDAGMRVVVLSSRPVSLYPEVYLQTVEFLQRNNMVPDVLAFKSGKHVAAELDLLWPRVCLFVDDEEHHLVNIKNRHDHVYCIHAKTDSPNYMFDVAEEARRLFASKGAQVPNTCHI